MVIDEVLGAAGGGDVPRLGSWIAGSEIGRAHV